LIISGGSFLIFLERPISLLFIIAAFILLLSPLFPGIKKRKKFIPPG
jgi:TctA family transporter